MYAALAPFWQSVALAFALASIAWLQFPPKG
jgi:hypothetical protein